MAKDFIPDPDDVTADYPGSAFSPWPILDRSTSHASVAETFTVPGSASEYTVRLDFGILQQIPMTVTDTTTSTVLLAVPWDVTPGANEVAVNFNRGLLRLHSSREGNSGSISYQPIGSVIDGMWQMKLQREVEALGNSGARLSGGNSWQGTQTFNVNPASIFEIVAVGGSGGPPFLRFRDTGQSRQADILFNSGGSNAFSFTRPLLIPTGTSIPGDQITGTVKAGQLPTQAARRDQTNAFAQVQTMNGGTARKVKNTVAGTNTLVLGDWFVQIHISLGNITLDLNTSAFPIGYDFWMSIINSHATNQLTFDAGSGNFVHAPGSYNQLWAMNTTMNAAHRWFRLIKISATAWSLDTGAPS